MKRQARNLLLLSAKATGAPFAALLMLSGCGNAPELQVGVVVGLAEAVRPALEARSFAPVLSVRRAPQVPLVYNAEGFPGLDPALVAGYSEPLLGAVLPSRNAAAGLGLYALHAGRSFWQSPDRAGLIVLDPGIVVATRGLGLDLDAADASMIADLIASGRSGSGERRFVWRDGLYRPQEARFFCRVTLEGRTMLSLAGRARPVLVFREDCASAEGAALVFTNRYWRDAERPLIWQSSQWLGNTLGTLYLQRLVE